MLEIDPRQTAVVLVDYQKGTLAMPLQPHSGAEIIANAVSLAEACAEAGGLVVRIRVDFSEAYVDRLQQPVDMPIRLPPGNPPADFAEFPPEIAAIPAHLTITKRQWSAFFGTELDRYRHQFRHRIHRPRCLVPELCGGRRRGRREQPRRRAASVLDREGPAAARSGAIDGGGRRSACGRQGRGLAGKTANRRGSSAAASP